MVDPLTTPDVIQIFNVGCQLLIAVCALSALVLGITHSRFTRHRHRSSNPSSIRDSESGVTVRPPRVSQEIV